ncbi:hypothetical protein Patl1_33090 [Pistacia atlantica]|uniref:Uncharacterized protein n=1 Tax=Pistacia atlantica TaxID=434234 RepID=A0ACC1ALZ9_9ROSI|nr:hypothetical protein Patl1_33090 [Pistacia atlantica]
MPRDAILFYAQMKECAHYTLCDNYTYSSAFKACAATHNFRVGKAVHCYFVRGLLNPSRIVYNYLLNMYSTCLSSVVDSEIGGCGYYDFDYSKHGIQFEGMESYLIDMYAKSGLIKASQQIFERNHPGDRDQATWNAMIAGYTQNGLVEEAFITYLNRPYLIVQNSTRAYSRSSASSSAMGQHDRGVAREVDAIYCVLPVCASVPLRDLRGYST